MRKTQIVRLSLKTRIPVSQIVGRRWASPGGGYRLAASIGRCWMSAGGGHRLGASIGRRWVSEGGEVPVGGEYRQAVDFG